MTAVSNELDEDLLQLASPTADFSVQAIGIVDGSPPMIVRWAGGPIPDAEVAELRDKLDLTSSQGRPLTSAIVARVLVETIRRVADRNSFVGKNIRVSVLPRQSVPATDYTVPLRRNLELADDLLIDRLTCLYVPEQTSPTEAIFHGPISVCPGAVTRGAEIWTTKPSWWKD